MVNRRSSGIAATTEPGTAAKRGVSPASVAPLIPTASLAQLPCLRAPRASQIPAA
jgi:hypothetical protein